MAAIDTHVEVAAFVEALEACRKLKDRNDRQQVLLELPDEISGRTQQYDDARSHILSIVRACIEIPGGIDALLKCVGAFDGATRAWEGVEHTAAALKAKLALAAATAADAVNEHVPSAGDRNLALVIGISQYKHGAAANHELKPEQFTNLAFAADDARAVHGSLDKHSNYLMSPLLVNEEATREGILGALDELRRLCRSRQQTVVIYFSGHGASDADGRHFLVPHDARRDALFASALWSVLFERALQEIPTDRLVVFLDACHAGAIGAPSAKDAELARFDPGGLKSMTPELGRFMVASCQARQRSLEADGHGIFTQHLLELLESEDPDILPEVEVDLFDLYNVLRTRVKETASAKFRGQQDPYANFRQRTGVVLRVQSERRKAYLKALLACLAPAGGQSARVVHAQRRRIEIRLTDYVTLGERDPVLQAFYDCFDEGLRRTRPDNDRGVEEDCRDLVKFFDQATVRTTQPVPSTPRPSSVPDSSPREVREDREPSVTTQRVSPSADSNATARLLGGSMPGAPLAAPQEDRRVLDEAAAKYVLADILGDARLFREAGALSDLLTRADGVSPADVTTWLLVAVPRVAVPEWEARKDQIAARFMERFPDARKVVRVSAVDLRTSRDN